MGRAAHLPAVVLRHLYRCWFASRIYRHSPKGPGCVHWGRQVHAPSDQCLPPLARHGMARHGQRRQPSEQQEVAAGPTRLPYSNSSLCLIATSETPVQRDIPGPITPLRATRCADAFAIHGLCAKAAGRVHAAIDTRSIHVPVISGATPTPGSLLRGWRGQALDAFVRSTCWKMDHHNHPRLPPPAAAAAMSAGSCPVAVV